MDNNSNINKYLQPLVLTIGASVIYDFFWIIIHFSTFIIGEDDDPEINLKRIVFILSIGDSFIKACLIWGLNNIRKQKNDELEASLNGS